MYYYEEGGHAFASEERLPLPESAPCSGATLLFRREAESCRSAFVARYAEELRGAEDVAMLDETHCHEALPVPARAVNFDHPRWRELAQRRPKEGKWRVHILALGDVGSTILTGLKLLGGQEISAIGICDLDANACRRWEFEMNQVALPWNYEALPPVEIVENDRLFDCDAFLFVASRGVPAVGSGVQDVRMAQFAANRTLVRTVARQARVQKFAGLFAVISDPVDLLAREAYLSSNLDAEGRFDGQGLLSEQVQGYGLGVMNARAAYYAKKDPRFAPFLTEGRAFGPHGKGLVIADSIEHYNDERSRELTELALGANLVMREMGFKPYVAPALSSAVLSILLTMRGEWHYSSVCLGNIFMGVKNRTTGLGVETEMLPLPPALSERLKTTQEILRKTWREA
jgi:hypothetical protein